MEDYRTKVRVIIGIIVVAISVLGIRLGQLQLLEATAYSGETRSMAVREKRVTPARGAIYDRNGKLMVDNEFTYTVTLTPRYFDESKIPLLAELLDELTTDEPGCAGNQCFFHNQSQSESSRTRRI